MTQNWIGQVNVNTEDGSDLVGRLNNFDTAHKTNQAGATRPTGISAGGLWSKDNGGGSFTLMLFDGSTDIPLTSLPGGLAAGDMFYWNGTALVRIPAGTNGQALIYDASLTKPKWGSAGGGMTAIGTQATTSGGSVSLSGMTLTDYKFLRVTFNRIRVGTVASSDPSEIVFNGLTILPSLANNTRFSGIAEIDLTNGIQTCTIRSQSDGSYVSSEDSGITTVSTAVTLERNGLGAFNGNFSAGEFVVYGVK
ncbi:hypothetical protein KPG71_18700 [Roseovarius sp. PS-C2]|uniref:hypothetical protein n=1 Tax=Roseovarius sp. PS-C2 TaxID=2820814 RepID=UPI001C0B07E8|nr:hypothetical protein [Roseovarius sp. PS-C2]MBU3262055.1 hypothetical protein [Roseovarius sp. PS-C2]